MKFTTLETYELMRASRPVKYIEDRFYMYNCICICVHNSLQYSLDQLLSDNTHTMIQVINVVAGKTNVIFNLSHHCI